MTPGSTQVRLLLEDGSDYGFTGTVQFSELQVNESTGSVTLRARFPNPQGTLLPGQFVQTRFNQAVIGLVSLAALVTGWWVLLALLALQLALGLRFGRRWCLPCDALRRVCCRSTRPRRCMPLRFPWSPVQR